MEKIITYETLRNFAYSNDALCHTPIRGIVLTFNGLGFSTMVWDDESPIDQEYASQGIIHVIPYYNPWCWMNRQAVDYVDEIVDVLFGRYALEDYDTVVLGCTHFNFFKDTLRRLLPGNISLLDGSNGTVKHLQHLLAERGLGENNNGQVTYYQSGKLMLDTTPYEALLSRLDQMQQY